MIASIHEFNNFLGTVWFLKDVEASWWDRSAFLLGHLALQRIHEGGLGEDLMGSALIVVVMGRWPHLVREPLSN